MDKVTLSLELTYTDAVAVLRLLSSSSTGHIEPSEVPTTNDNTSEDKVLEEPIKTPSEASTAVVVATTPGKKTKMPAFGRTQEQVNAFLATKQAKLDEDEEKQQAKQQKLADAEAESQVAQELKDADKTTETTAVKKPLWLL